MTILLVNVNCRLIWMERSVTMKNQDKQKGVTCLKDTEGSQHLREAGRRDKHFAILDRAACF